jgi:hypothetical protein
MAAQKTKDWSLTPLKAGASEVREYAELRKRTADDFDAGPLASIQDAAKIEVSLAESDEALETIGELGRKQTGRRIHA